MTDPERTTPRYLGPDTSGRKDQMTRAEIQGRFDREVAALYSQRDPLWLPEFRRMFSLIPKLLQPALEQGGTFLDIGAGTGNLSRSVLEVFPQARAVLMDFSANMLSEVPNVLAAFVGRFETLAADFIEADFGIEHYGAVISSFAIHHCRGEKEYGRVYQKAFRALRNNGIFVCCDVIAGASQALSDLNENGWREFLSAQGMEAAEVERILSNYHVEDSPISMAAHFSLLREAGFTEVDVVYKRDNFGIYTGSKR